MLGGDGGGLSLPTGRVMCPVHGEPLRARWPAGYPAFVAAGLESLKLCDTWLNNIDGDAASIMAALDTRPICCTVAAHDPDLLLAMYEAAGKSYTTTGGLWGVRRCSVCHKRRQGCSPAVAGVPAGAWVCLHCVAQCGAEALRGA
jgi:hypothetical protein